MRIGPISDYDYWKLASPYEGGPEPEEEYYDGDDDSNNDEKHCTDDDR